MVVTLSFFFICILCKKKYNNNNNQLNTLMNNTINGINTALKMLELFKQNGVSDIQKYELLLSRIASLEQENEGLKQENEKLKEKISQLKLRREIDEGRAG